MGWKYDDVFCKYVTVNLAIVPTRRDVFPDAKNALEHKRQVMPVLLRKLETIHDVNVITVDGIVPDGMLCEEKYVKVVEDYLADKHVDALFIPHMNFGQEESVARLAKHLGVPVLLWGPRDGEKGSDKNFRLYDTQCGMFATSRALLRYGIPFTYIENCWIDDPALDEGLDRFIRVASMVKAFRGMRILQISTRPHQFLSVKINEGELFERFGIEVVPVPGIIYTDIVDDLLTNHQDMLDEVIAEFKKDADFTGASSHEKNVVAAAFIAMKQLAEQFNCSAVAAECWDINDIKYGVSPCFANAELTQSGLPVACECDINGAITSVLLQAATRRETSNFFADITVRHPSNDNAELMWHCGPYPPELAREGKAVCKAGQSCLELKHGGLTMTRFDGDRGNFVMFADTGNAVDGPPTSGSYVWLETRDWSAWEKKLMFGPYIHHSIGAHGDYKETIKEACRYLGIMYDSVD